MFTDVSRDHKDWDAINYVVDTGLMTGYADGSFRPDDNISAGEVYLIIYHLFPNEEILQKMGASNGHWATLYAKYCKHCGFISEDYLLSPEFLDRPISTDFLISCFQKIGEIKEIPLTSIFMSLREPMVSRVHIAKFLYSFGKEICRNKEPEIISYINQENDCDALRVINEYSFCISFLPSDIRYAYIYVKQGPSAYQEKNFTYMMKIMRCKNAMFQKDANGVPLSTMNLFQYTGWGALKGIASSPLWLTPVAYLNDPNEGKLGFDIAKGMFKKIGAIFQNWDIKDIRQSFVGSFTMSQKESLPMWVHYGEGGNGCRIEFKCSDLKEPVYRVFYVKKRFTECLNQIKSILEEYLTDFEFDKSDLKNPVLLFARDSLSQACYLYKSKDYSYENEARIIRMQPFYEAKRKPEIIEGEIFPRIYAELQDKAGIESVTLGPKVDSFEKYAVAIANQRIVEFEDVHKSMIAYR